MYKSKIVTTIKYAVFLLFLICVFQKPQEASAQVIQGNNITFEVGNIVDDDNCPTSSKGWIYIHDRSTGNKYFFYAFDNKCKTIQLYRNGDHFYLSMRTGWKYKRANKTTWNTETTSTESNYSVGINVATCDLYVVVGGSSIPVYLDGVCLWNPLEPSPTPSPTPTPILVASVDANDVGLTEIFGFVMEILNIPIIINGYEITWLQILIYIALATITLELIFSGVKD